VGIQGTRVVDHSAFAEETVRLGGGRILAADGDGVN